MKRLRDRLRFWHTVAWCLLWHSPDPMRRSVSLYPEQGIVTVGLLACCAYATLQVPIGRPRRELWGALDKAAREVRAEVDRQHERRGSRDRDHLPVPSDN